MNTFSKLHPIVIFIYFSAVLAASMFINNPIVSAASLLGGALFCGSQKLLKLSDIGFYLPLFLLISVTNPLFSHNGKTPLFFMNGNAVTLEAVFCGVQIALTVISVMLWCRAFGAVMTSDRLVYLFGRVSPKLSVILTTALRYIPMLRRQAKKISRAQKAMGMHASDSRFDRMRTSLGEMSALVGWSLESSVETSRAMKARGYGLRGRTCYSDYKFCARDVRILCAVLILSAVTFTGRAVGCIDFGFYPAIYAAHANAAAYAVYIGFAALVLLPVLMETEENIRWKYYRSKI